ncbi:MAG TPA: hypothetical protein DC049_02120, partial [Spirochaetia bacterium]|nr:hypothetical protein [Spirochaetia bacterium]
ETFTPASNFDLIAVTVPSELTYTNILHFLKLADIPLRSKDRPGTPLILAGGIAVFNPEPLAHFIDAFFLGEAEDQFIEILRAAAEIKKPERSREKIFNLFDRHSCIYIPEKHKNSFYEKSTDYYCLGGKEKVIQTGKTLRTFKKAFPARLDNAPVPLFPPLPDTEIVQARCQVEIARGCPRSCRFCAAGFFYRPYRERTLANIQDCGLQVMRNTGFDEFNLSGLSVSDYSKSSELIETMSDTAGRLGVSLSLPSLRINTLAGEDLAALSVVRRSGLTFAIETPGERGRNIIKKDITNQEIFSTIDKVRKNGWKLVKFYFMIGLPFLENEDTEIAEFLLKIAHTFPGLKINVNINTFVPKPNTPFQWAKFILPEKAHAVLEKIQNKLAGCRRIVIRTQNPDLSYIEAFLAGGSAE